MTTIQRRVQDVIESGVTYVTRRAEIYENDGVTLFADSDNTPRMTDGNVSVDMSRPERRALDVTFDNSDGLLAHDPNGFWYDKVIKVFRGTRWKNTNPQPKILVIQNTLDIITGLKRVGFADITVSTPTAVSELLNYDIVIANGSSAALTAANRLLVASAYAQGVSILTIGNEESQTTLPTLIASSLSKIDGSTWGATPVTTDTPFSGAWAAFTGAGTDTGTLPVTLAANVNIAGTFTYSSTARPVLLYTENAKGGRWFHSSVSYVNNTGFNQLIKSVLTWLYTAYGDQEWETQLGEFCIDRIVEPNFPNVIKVTGRDYAKRLLGAKFSTALTFPSGTPVDTLVRAVAANGGITKMTLGLGGLVTGTELSFDRTAERWAVIEKAVESVSGEAYFDSQGYLVTRLIRDPFLTAPSLTLQTGSSGNLVDYEKSSTDTRIYNRVVVTGENADLIKNGIYLQSIAENREPSSPTRIAVAGTPGGLSERTYFYTSSFFTQQAQLDLYADKLLKIVALEEFDLNFSSIPFYWSEAGDVLEFLDPKPGNDEPTRFLLSGFSIPLGLGPMTGNGKRVTRVGSAATIGDTGAVSPTATVPTAPLNVVATAGTGTADLVWEAPASDGGSPVIGYKIEKFVSGSWSTVTSNTGTTAVTRTVTGLAASATAFRISAINAVGTGPVSATSNTVTPGVSGVSRRSMVTKSTASGTVTINTSEFLNASAASAPPQTGDLIVIVVSWNGFDGDGVGFPTGTWIGSGCASGPGGDGADTYGLDARAKIYAAESSFTVTAPTGARVTAIAYSGAAAIRNVYNTGFRYELSAASASSLTASAFTTITANSVVLDICKNATINSALTVASGMTDIKNDTNTGGASVSEKYCIGELPVASVGSTGTRVWNRAGSSTPYAIMVLQLLIDAA